VTLLDKDAYGAHLYDFEPSRRNESQPPEDITTFLAPQKRWGFQSKEHRPDILFQLYPSVDFLDGRNNPVAWLEFDIDGVTKLVVDVFTQRPLRDFSNIPVQLATNVEGGRLEAICREDCRIATEDLLQRMIPLLDDNGEPQRDDKGGFLSQRPVRNALNNVKTQFRNKCRCLSWQKGNHDSEFDNQLFKRLSEEDKAANTTRNLPDLTSNEITAIRSLAKTRKKRATEVNEVVGEAVGEAAAEPTQGVATEAARSPSASNVQNDAGDTDLLQNCDVPTSSQVSLDLISKRVIETGSVAQNRRQKGKHVERDQSAGGENPLQSSGDTIQNEFQVIDPALNTPADTAPSGDVEHPLALAKISRLSPNVNQSDTLSAATSAIETATDALRRDELALKRKLADEPGNSDEETSQISNHATEEPEASIPPRKRLRIVPPSGDPNSLLKSFGAELRPASAPFRLGNVPKLGTFTHTASRSLERRSESPQPYASRPVTPLLPHTAPLIRPQPYLSNQFLPFDPEKTQEAKDARFAAAAEKVSSIQTLKAELLKAWWSNQVSTTSGGSLYGPVLNISLSQLGPQSSFRTDVEVRNLMSAYHIPPDWSASSINLRQHAALRQAVHAALCEAERWNERNYRKDFPGHLDLGMEGGFFLAPAQPITVNDADSRFIPFTSQTQLNASLHSALWRYRQLTGRSFATVPGQEAFSTDGGVSYHDAWCEVRRQVFLPYFLRFKDPVEAVEWMPAFGMLRMWVGGPEKWETSYSHVSDEFGCRDDRAAEEALDLRRFLGKHGEKGKVGLPVQSVDLDGMGGVVESADEGD
jgi:hypothetical protein